MIPKLVIWGAGEHALVVADIIRGLGTHEIVGLLDDVNPQPRRVPHHSASVLGGSDELQRLHDEGVRDLIVGVGDCRARLRLAELATSKGFHLATAIHPRATVARGVPVGRGTVICAGAIVGPGSRIGENVIINTAASVDHGCIVDDGAHVGPGAHLGGNVAVRRAAWVAIGATVSDRVTIGAGSVLGAGAVLLKDLPEAVVAYGVPATVRKGVAPDD